MVPVDAVNVQATSSHGPTPIVDTLTQQMVIDNPAAPMPEARPPVSTQLSLFSYLTLILRTKRTISLWCLIDGDSRPFEVDAPVDVNVNRLKEAIRAKKERGFLRDVDASDLELWKVRDR